VTRPDALYLNYEYSLMWVSMGFSFSFINPSLSRMQDDKDQEVGGVGGDMGNNGP
jgi:hypothetical protein